MRFLLDTHVFLWLQTEPERLDDALLDRLGRADALLLSPASAWEMAIKYHLGKLPLPAEPGVYVPDRMARSGVEPLPIEITHTLAAGGLPPHHRDPFDRLLVAQSQLTGLPLVTADRQIAAYDVEVIQV